MQIRSDNTRMAHGTGFCTRSVPFCSVLFCSVLLRSVLFLFCSVLLCSILLCSVLFWLALVSKPALHSIGQVLTSKQTMLTNGRLWTFWLDISIAGHASFNALVHSLQQGLSPHFKVAFADMPVQQRMAHQGFLAARALPVTSERDSGWTILGLVAH